MKSKSNLILFTIIALVVGFLIGYLAFGSGASSTGEAKGVKYNGQTAYDVINEMRGQI